jgi:MFS family permease
MSLVFNFNFIAKHKKVYFAFLCFAFFCLVFLFTHIKFNNDFSQMLPSVLEKEMKLFQNSPLSNKLFVIVKPKDLSQSISSKLLDNDLLGLSSPQLDIDFALSYYHYFPNLWDDDTQKEVGKILTPQKIKERFNSSVQRLNSFEAVFSQDLILADPLNLAPIFLEKLKILDFGGAYSQNKISDRELLIFDYPKNFLDLTNAKAMKVAFDDIKKQLPAGSEIFYMGAPRYTIENNEVIISDIVKISTVSFVLMVIMFLLFLRDKRAIFIYIVPAIVIVVAAVITAAIFKGMSAITIGFGSVVMGLSVDYCLYMYFAIGSSPNNDGFANARKMFKPIAVSAVTSIITFVLLLFSSIEVFKQVAVFCASGLIVALFIALFIAPFIFKSGARENKTVKKINGFSLRMSIIVLVIIFIAAVASFKFIHFDASVQGLNVASKQLEADRKVFDEMTGSGFGENKMFIVFGDSLNGVLENNEMISKKNPQYLKLASLFPSDKTKQSNKENWEKFWNADKVSIIKNLSVPILRDNQIRQNAFDDFFDFLRTADSDDDFNLTKILNPVIEIDSGFAFINIVSDQAEVSGIDGIETMSISNKSLQDKISSDVSKRFAKIMVILLVSSFIVLFLILKRLRLAALAVLPAVGGIAVFFIAAAIFQIKINLIGIYALPLLIGLGADYGVFMIFQTLGGNELHPTKAVALAALSTIIGFGSLMEATHSVLFVIGFMVFVGIVAAVCISIFIIPAFVKKEI